MAGNFFGVFSTYLRREIQFPNRTKMTPNSAIGQSKKRGTQSSFGLTQFSTCSKNTRLKICIGRKVVLGCGDFFQSSD